jgi:hypothetical protein
MKTNKPRITAALLVPAMLSLSMAQAAQPVPWDDLPKNIGRGKMRSDGREDRQYRVVTKDGLVHAGYALTFSPVGVKVSPLEPSIPREQVREIRIHRDQLLSDALKAPAARVFDPLCHSEVSCFILGPFVLPLIPVAIGITAGAAPIVLPIEGIKRLLPDKVIKVAP